MGCEYVLASSTQKTVRLTGPTLAAEAKADEIVVPIPGDLPDVDALLLYSIILVSSGVLAVRSVGCKAHTPAGILRADPCQQGYFKQLSRCL